MQVQVHHFRNGEMRQWLGSLCLSKQQHTKDISDLGLLRAGVPSHTGLQAMALYLAIIISADIKISESGLDWCVSTGWVSALKAKSCWFDSPSENMHGLWDPVSCLGGDVGQARGNQSMFLSHIDVSLPLFLLAFLSLSK